MRRREPVVERREGKAPPLWIRQTLQALAEYHRRHRTARKGSTAIPEGFTQWWRAERDAWCREHGCHRPGKSCEQIPPMGKDCGARGAAR
ncbi:hypothetical protein [Actinoplanes teichomyceticus]|uniref:hypothetical protein n=1 Tax=Actinoplanes teichomyceticus TaxID=1867 RepID=UPI00119D4C86|nr:hypothetical protein [Actinoplanes teichomyceticus]